MKDLGNSASGSGWLFCELCDVNHLGGDGGMPVLAAAPQAAESRGLCDVRDPKITSTGENRQELLIFLALRLTHLDLVFIFKSGKVDLL